MDLPACGFHYGVPFEQYRQWPAANISTLKGMKRTPLHCKWDMDHPKKRTDEMDVGSAEHMALLEPARFHKEFYLGSEEYNATTKEGKELRAAEMEAAAGRTVIRRKAGEDTPDADDVRGMMVAIRQFKTPSAFLDMAGQCEVSALWKDPQTGTLCKARFDKLITTGDGAGIILEIKTCRDASEWAFGGQCAKLGYAAQAAYYRWGCQVLGGKLPNHVFLAIENKGPWAAATWTLGDQDLQTGALLWRDWLDRFAACQKSGKWPGYPDRVQTLSMPSWAHREVETE